MRSTVASKMQGRMTEKESEYSADTCTYPRMILKFIRSHRSRIPTYDISLFTGAPSVPKKAIFKYLEFQMIYSAEFESVW